MADKQSRALGRLLKKLSALRVTLGKDERDLLDQLVLGAKAEVGGHALTSRVAAKPSSKPSERIAGRAEVGGHALTSRVTAKPSTKPSERIADRAEVGGHALTSRVTAKPSERITLQGRIVFDNAKKTYKVSE